MPESSCAPHEESRFSDHIETRPRPSSFESVTSRFASPTVSRSVDVSFWPIIGVIPSLRHSSAWVSRMPARR